MSKVRTTGDGKFAEPGTRSAVAVTAVTHVIASADDLSVRSDLLAAGGTAAAAHEALAQHLAAHPEDAGSLQVMPTHEAVAA